MLHGQHGLEKPDGSGPSQQVASVGLGRTDDAARFGGVLLGPERLQARELHGVTHRRARGVTLHQIHVARAPTGRSVSASHGPQLSFLAGGQEAALHVVGEADAPHDGSDPISMLQCVGEALHYQNSGALAHHQAVTLVIEGRAAACGRDGQELGETHLGVQGVGPGQSTGEDGVEAAAPEGVDGELQGEEGRGARRVQAEPLPTEAQGPCQHGGGKPGDPAVDSPDRNPILHGHWYAGRPEELALEATPQDPVGHGRSRRRGEDDVAEHDTHASGIDRIGDGVVPRLPAGVQRQVDHGIEGVDKLRRQIQAGRIQLEVSNEAGPPGVDVIRPGVFGIVRLLQIQVPAAQGWFGGGVDAGLDDAPEVIGGSGTGEHPAEADDCDRLG